MSILCLGESLIDVLITPAGDITEVIGGSAFNVAKGLGHPTRLATWLGQDAYGDRIAASAKDHGVELVPGSRGAKRTSVAKAQLSQDGDATYEFAVESDLPDVNLRGVDHIHFCSFAALMQPSAAKIRALLRATGPGVTVSYDPNIRPSLIPPGEQSRTMVEEYVSLADVVKASHDDVGWLYPDRPAEDVARSWADSGPELVIITRGGDGATVFYGGKQWSVSAPEVTVVDTVGAGDAFMAGLLTELTWPLSTDMVRRAVLRATDAASVVVGRAGA